MGSRSTQPHVMVFPLPVQGHLTPMMHFSIKLAAQGIMVTFVTTQDRLAHILRAATREGPAPGIMIEGIRLAGLEDGLPEGHDRSPVSMDFINAVGNLGAELEKLVRAMASDEDLPPLTCLVSDSFLPWTQDLANKWGIPRALFWTQSLAVGSTYMSLSRILASGYDPFVKRVKGRGGEGPMIRSIPGLPPMDPYDLPFFSDFNPAEEESENTKWLRGMLESQFHRVNESAWFIVNSFHELEGPFAQALCSSSILLPPSNLLLLGPLNTLHPPSATSFRASLLREDDDDCLGWLDSQPDSSVLYISFGSVAVRTLVAIQELAMALLACRQPFLWALRTGWKEVRESLSAEFWEFAMEAGKVTTWTPQLKVLSHRAVGGFLTHAGWNSTLESVSAGVPMLAWPCFLDQFMNSWAISCYWGIGVQVMKEEGSDGMVQELQTAIATLMRGEQSLVFRRRVAQLRAACVADSSPSHQHFTLFVEDMFRRASS